MTLNLAHNEAPYDPAPGCLAVHHGIAADTLRRYSPSFGSGGHSPLAVRLAALCAVDVDRVVLGAGAEGLLSAVFATLRRGDVVALPDGSWPHYRALAAQVGARVAAYPVQDLGDRFEADVDGLLALAGLGAPIRLLLIASPANPTGELFPVERVAEVARAFPDAVVAADLAYTGCGDEPPDWTAWAALTRSLPNLLVLHTFSKAFALAGLRVGWEIAGAGLDDLVTRGVPYLGYNHASELTAIAALDDPGYYAAQRAVMAEERLRYYRALPLAGPDGAVQVYRSGGNFLPVRFSPAALPVVHDALAVADIVIKWLPDGLTRITLGTPEQNATVLRVLVRALSGLPERPTRQGRRADLIPAYQLVAATNGSKA